MGRAGVRLSLAKREECGMRVSGCKMGDGVGESLKILMLGEKLRHDSPGIDQTEVRVIAKGRFLRLRGVRNIPLDVATSKERPRNKLT